MDNNERSSNGAYHNLHGMSEHEQSKHGVGFSDTEGSAWGRVMAGRNSQLNASAPGEPFSAGTRGGFCILLAALVLLIGIGYISDDWEVFDPPAEVWKFTRTFKPGTSPITRKNMRASVVKDLTPIFVKGTPLSTIFAGCENRNCIQPDLRAFNAFAKYAADPAAYSSQVCEYYFTQFYLKKDVFWSDWPRKWSGGEHYLCLIVNGDELQSKTFWHNLRKAALPISIVSLILFGVFAMYRAVRR